MTNQEALKDAEALIRATYYKAVEEGCKYYIKGGLCASSDAPKPGHSECIGKDACGSFEQRDKRIKP